MKNKRENCSFTTPEGVVVPGWIDDDGVTVRRTYKYADIVRAEIAHYEVHGYPTGTVTGPDPLDRGMEAAERYLEYVAENADTLPEADVDAAHRLCAYRDNLRDALEGGDLRNAARAGVEFGRSLEQMRVRLASSAVKGGRAVQQAARDGHIATHGTDAEKQARWAGYQADYDALRDKNPFLSREEICRKVAKKHSVSTRTIKRHTKK